MLRELCPCSSWRSREEQRSTCSLWKAPRQSRWMPRGGCDPVGNPHWRRSCKDLEQEESMLEQEDLLGRLVIPWGIHAGTGCSWRTAPNGKWPMLKQIMKDCSSWEGFMLEKFVEDCLPWEGLHAAAGEGVLLLREEAVTETWWTDCNPHSPSCATKRKSRERTGSTVKPGKEGGVSGIFRICFTSHFHTLIWLVINSITFPTMSLFCPWQQAMMDLSLPLPHVKRLSLYFLLPAQLRRGGIEQLWWVPDI